MFLAWFLENSGNQRRLEKIKQRKLTNQTRGLGSFQISELPFFEKKISALRLRLMNCPITQIPVLLLQQQTSLLQEKIPYCTEHQWGVKPFFFFSQWSACKLTTTHSKSLNTQTKLSPLSYSLYLKPSLHNQMLIWVPISIRRPPANCSIQTSGSQT